MERKELIGKILEDLHVAQEFIRKCALNLNELLGDYDAGDDVAAWKRTKFVLSVNDVAPIGDVGERDARLQEKEKPADTQERKGNFYITTEEIKKMPKTIKGKFFTQGFAVCWRKRKSGKNSFTYQVRFQRGEYNIQFHEKKKENLKARFLEELVKQTQANREEYTPSTTFGDFAVYYFEKFRKAKVAKTTFEADKGRLKKVYLAIFSTKNACKDNAFRLSNAA